MTSSNLIANLTPGLARAFEKHSSGGAFVLRRGNLGIGMFYC